MHTKSERQKSISVMIACCRRYQGALHWVQESFCILLLDHSVKFGHWAFPISFSDDVWSDFFNQLGFPCGRSGSYEV